MNFALPFGGLAARPNHSNRLALALTLSVLLHLFVLFGLRFRAPDLQRLDNFSPPLDVVLVNAKSATKPPHADALAQANLEGGGNTEAKRRAKSPLPVLQRDQGENEVARKARQVRELEEQAQKLLTRAQSQKAVAPTHDQPQRPAVQADTPDGADLVQKSLEMARLQAQISRDWDNYQQRPKRVFIGASTREYTFARYVEDWRTKVERIGNLNYPEDARQQKLYGSLRMTVNIRSDGSLYSVEINRSSGSKVLDAAAIRIVKLAAPYAPFPADIRSKADILGIVRTWTFTHADQLVGGD